ncbi:hypothetical protein FB451DRAFT_1167937 [Mycena latifolia]|nr:hypothetical protein FB451DRAFT_1167937 [Mycena latifolia]
MDNDPTCPHPPHSAPLQLNSAYSTHTGSDEHTRANLRALRLAAVGRQAQVTMLTMHLQNEREDGERARAETKEMQVQLAALQEKYERAQRWCAVNHKRKNEENAADGGADSSPSRNPEQAGTSTLRNSSPDPKRPVLPGGHAQVDRDPRKRIKLNSVAVAAAGPRSAPAANHAKMRGKNGWFDG